MIGSKSGHVHVHVIYGRFTQAHSKREIHFPFAFPTSEKGIITYRIVAFVPPRYA